MDMDLYAAENLQNDLQKNYQIKIDEKLLLILLEYQLASSKSNKKHAIENLRKGLVPFVPRTENASLTKPQKLILALQRWGQTLPQLPLPGTDERGNFNCELSQQRSEYFSQYLNSEKSLDQIWSSAPAHLFTAYRIKKIQDQLEKVQN